MLTETPENEFLDYDSLFKFDLTKKACLADLVAMEVKILEAWCEKKYPGPSKFKLLKKNVIICTVEASIITTVSLNIRFFFFFFASDECDDVIVQILTQEDGFDEIEL